MLRTFLVFALPDIADIFDGYLVVLSTGVSPALRRKGGGLTGRGGFEKLLKRAYVPKWGSLSEKGPKNGLKASSEAVTICVGFVT